MHSKVLWTLDNELSPRQFERLCVDLLFRAGFRDIVPIDPQDAGRDAEQESWRGRGRAGELTFFQFSTEADWRRKLTRDMYRVFEGGHRPSTFVFVSTRSTRGVDRDAAVRSAQEKYGWSLMILSREWLRVQLEEAQPDLAQKYLGLEAPDGINALRPMMVRPALEQDDLRSIQGLMQAHEYDRAAIAIRDHLRHDEYRTALWEALAWCQYQERRYDEALTSIHRALDLEASAQAISIRGCILAERGIERHDRASLLEARDAFLLILSDDSAGTWVDWYNLGNVLAALGSHRAAVEHYNRALELNNSAVEVLKNLASAYHLLGVHQEEMECFDRALELNPLKPEALASKGISLLIDFDDAPHAVLYLRQAMSVDDSWGVRWPHIWYWLAEAHRRAGENDVALDVVDEGLRHQPGHRGLRRLKSDLLNVLVSQPDVWPLAAAFWTSALELEPHDFDSRQRLVRLCTLRGDEDGAWELIDEAFQLFDLDDAKPLSASPHSVQDALAAIEWLPAYRAFRHSRPVQDYWNSDDPLYDLDYSIPFSRELSARLTSELLLPFGLAATKLQELRSDGLEPEAVSEILGGHAAQLIRITTQSSQELAYLIPQNGAAHSVSQAITEVILFIGLATVREFGAQLGWLGSLALVPNETYQRALDMLPYENIHADAVSGCLVPLNQIAGFSPEE